MAAHQVLVAIDWDGKGDIDKVLAFVNKHDALVSHERTTIPHYATKAPIPSHRVTFDPDKVRNTEVHASGFHAGFVVHIE